jgi:hypothetical protein
MRKNSQDFMIGILGVFSGYMPRLTISTSRCSSLMESCKLLANPRRVSNMAVGALLIAMRLLIRLFEGRPSSSNELTKQYLFAPLIYFFIRR